jgi:hypothetical protein
MKYLHIDCEMGGRDLKYSLLTAYFLVTDDSFRCLGDLYLQVKPDDGDYIVSGEGMRVNGINLQEHDKVATPYKQAKPLLFNFLKALSNGGHLTPVGHGVKGDISHVIDKLISEGSWNQFCTYHYIDTSVVLQFLRACGKMPVDCDGSVSALAKHFGILVEGNLHDARVDAKLTADVLWKMIQLGR